MRLGDGQPMKKKKESSFIWFGTSKDSVPMAECHVIEIEFLVITISQHIVRVIGR
jgi:hypothetical protein